MLQHYHQVKVSAETCNTFVCDFSLVLDRAYADVTLNRRERNAFIAVFEEVVGQLGHPGLLVHLQCDAETELERIRHRGRAAEKRVSVEFLDSLNRAVKEQVEALDSDVEVLGVDSAHLNFATDSQGKQAVTNAVESALARVSKGRLHALPD